MVGAVLMQDPAIRGYSTAVGAGQFGQTNNNARFFISLKPWEERRVTAQQVIARLRPQMARLEGVQMFLSAGQDVRIGGRVSKTQYQYTLQSGDTGELYSWAPRILNKLRTLTELRDWGFEN